MSTVQPRPSPTTLEESTTAQQTTSEPMQRLIYKIFIVTSVIFTGVIYWHANDLPRFALVSSVATATILAVAGVFFLRQLNLSTTTPSEHRSSRLIHAFANAFGMKG